VRSTKSGLRPLQLHDAIQRALRELSEIKEAVRCAQAAEECIGVAAAAYLPALDMMWQEKPRHNIQTCLDCFFHSPALSMTGPLQIKKKI